MRRLVLSALIFGAFALSGGLAVGFSQYWDATNPRTLLRANPCALPCVWGITIGHSTRADALLNLPTATGAEVIDRGAGLLFFTLRHADTDAAQGIILIDLRDRTTVQTVRLSPIVPNPPLATLGEIMLLGLPPRRVLLSCVGGLPARILIVFGDNAEIIAEAPLLVPLSPRLPLALVDLSSRNIRSSYDARASFGCAVETAWRGFAPAWVYQRAATATLP